MTDIDALIERLRNVAHEEWPATDILCVEAADALAKLRERLGCPPADQERDHLHEQCMTLVKENARLREALEEIANLPDVRSDERSQIARAALGGNDENR